MRSRWETAHRQIVFSPSPTTAMELTIHAQQHITTGPMEPPAPGAPLLLRRAAYMMIQATAVQSVTINTALNAPFARNKH